LLLWIVAESVAKIVTQPCYFSMFCNSLGVYSGYVFYQLVSVDEVAQISGLVFGNRLSLIGC